MNVLKNYYFRFFAAFFICTLFPVVVSASSADSETIPVPGMVTMVDIGATECVPCKMMAPIIEELEVEYEGRAAIIFIDVWKNPNEGKKFGIKVIPTQIFYDAQGKEIQRHVGFLDKKSIVAIFDKLGVK